MSRAYDDYAEENYQNQAELWLANVERALRGHKGQQALRDLEQALLELPQPRLISGTLAHNGEVCTVGALALHRRTRKGESAEAVLADLERLMPVPCECWHPESAHEGGTGACSGCAADRARLAAAGRPGVRHEGAGVQHGCTGYVLGTYEDGDGLDVTATTAQRVGVTYTLGWHLGHLNDSHYAFGDCTPEERYERMLAWVRSQLQPLPA